MEPSVRNDCERCAITILTSSFAKPRLPIFARESKQRSAILSTEPWHGPGVGRIHPVGSIINTD